MIPAFEEILGKQRKWICLYMSLQLSTWSHTPKYGDTCLLGVYTYSKWVLKLLIVSLKTTKQPVFRSKVYKADNWQTVREAEK